jgi:hypothetical protein
MPDIPRSAAVSILALCGFSPPWFARPQTRGFAFIEKTVLDNSGYRY